MTQSVELLEPILRDRRLPELLHELTVQWKNEQRLRQQFYEKIQPGDKWEFINGKIILHSPAKEKHTDARQRLSFVLQAFVSLNNLGVVRDETSLVSLTRNDYLPDILFFSQEKHAGIHRNTWKYPIPDFIVEILSDSTEGTDRGIKKEDYASHGCQEYWLVDTDEQTVEQFFLDEQRKEFLLFTKKTMEDNISCRAISGLSFPVAAIFKEEVKWQVVKGWLHSEG